MNAGLMMTYWIHPPKQSTELLSPACEIEQSAMPASLQENFRLSDTNPIKDDVIPSQPQPQKQLTSLRQSFDQDMYIPELEAGARSSTAPSTLISSIARMLNERRPRNAGKAENANLPTIQ
jgi:hypothetical protein